MMTKTWINCEEIPGLTYIDNFISEDEERTIVNQLDGSHAWTTDISRRTIQYGYKFDYTQRRITSKMDPIPSVFDHVVQKLDSFYGSTINQMIINEYSGHDQGIKKHTDFNDFGPVIASISLLYPCVMLFYEVDTNEELTGRRAKLLLKPRSALILKDIARYQWKHEVPRLVDYKKLGLESLNIEILDQYRRVSLTFRTMDADKFDQLPSDL